MLLLSLSVTRIYCYFHLVGGWQCAFIYIITMVFFISYHAFFYVIIKSKQRLMWEFKIQPIAFQLNTTDRSTFRNHLCFHSDSCTVLWDLLLWVPAAISWSGKALESLSPPGDTSLLFFRLHTRSPQTLLTVTFLNNLSIQHQSGSLSINLEIKSHPISPTQHALPPTQTHTHQIARGEPH